MIVTPCLQHVPASWCWMLHAPRMQLQGTYCMVGLEGLNCDATETRGISLFSIAVLAASPEHSTDEEVLTMRGLAAQEYLHNWSGEALRIQSVQLLGVLPAQCAVVEHCSTATARMLVKPDVHRTCTRRIRAWCLQSCDTA